MAATAEAAAAAADAAVTAEAAAADADKGPSPPIAHSTSPDTPCRNIRAFLNNR
jgi:hypothetical protein